MRGDRTEYCAILNGLELFWSSETTHLRLASSYSQNARVEAGVQVKPGQQGGNWGGHCCPFAEQLGPDMLPEPLSRTVCGLPAALSAILIIPLRFPVAVGSKVTLMVQCAPAATVGPQSSVSPKFVVGVILVMLSMAVPELARVRGKGWLVWPTISMPKPKLVADTATFGDPLPNDSPPPQPMNGNNPQSTIARDIFTMAFS
jgi:hypothetical protein